LKIVVFCVMTPRSLVEVCQSFRDSTETSQHFTRLHSVTAQRTQALVVVAVKTLNLTETQLPTYFTCLQPRQDISHF